METTTLKKCGFCGGKYKGRSWVVDFDRDRKLCSEDCCTEVYLIEVERRDKDRISIEQWVEIDEETYWYMFGAVPLIFNRQNSFLINEPYGNTKYGKTYYACKHEGSRFYRKPMTKTEYLNEFNKIA